jgi:hypothetical protein
MGILRPATHYQVDLTGTLDQIRLSGLPDSVCAHQVDLTGGPDQVYVSGLPKLKRNSKAFTDLR